MTTTTAIVDRGMSKLPALAGASAAPMPDQPLQAKLEELAVRGVEESALEQIAELEQSFDNLTNEELEILLRDALWVNERLQDYTRSLGEGEDAAVILEDEEEEEESAEPQPSTSEAPR